MSSYNCDVSSQEHQKLYDKETYPFLDQMLQLQDGLAREVVQQNFSPLLGRRVIEERPCRVPIHQLAVQVCFLDPPTTGMVQLIIRIGISEVQLWKGRKNL